MKKTNKIKNYHSLRSFGRACKHSFVNYADICDAAVEDGWKRVKKPTEEILNIDWIDNQGDGVKVYFVNNDGRVRMCKRPIGVKLCADVYQTELLSKNTYNGDDIGEVMLSTCGNPY